MCHIIDIIYFSYCTVFFINCIIVQMVCNGATPFLLLPITIVCPKPCIFVLIEGHCQHFKASNSSFSKCKNELCDI